VHPHLSIDHLVLAAAGLLVAGALVTRLADRIRMPSLLLFLGLGMLIGDDGLGWVRLADPHLAQNLSVIALILILFDGGLSTPQRELRRIVGPATALATVGVGLTAAMVGWVAMLLLGVPYSTGLLIGAVVASTDAAAVFSILRRTPIASRLGALLETESGINDPMAMLLTAGLVASEHGGVTVWDWASFGLRQLAGGVGVGLLVGWLGRELLTRTGTRGGSAALGGLATAAAGYGIGAAIGASGFMAVFVAGVALGRGPLEVRATVRDFHGGLAAIAQLGVFLLLGIPRPAAVALSLFAFRLPTRELAFISWAGLRGAVPIVLATFPLTGGHPQGQRIFDVVFFVVLISVTVQGLTIGPLARRLGLREAVAR